jgi:hypothetical protein
MRYVRESRNRRRILWVGGLGNRDPYARLNVNAGRLAVCERVHVTDPLKVSQAVQVDVNLQKSPIGNIPIDFDKLQNFFSLVQFEKTILGRVLLQSIERPPNLVEAGTLPGPAQFR